MSKKKEEELFLDIFHDVQLTHHRSFCDCDSMQILDQSTGSVLSVAHYEVIEKEGEHFFTIYVDSGKSVLV